MAGGSYFFADLGAGTDFRDDFLLRNKVVGQLACKAREFQIAARTPGLHFHRAAAAPLQA